MITRNLKVGDTFEDGGRVFKILAIVPEGYISESYLKGEEPKEEPKTEPKAEPKAEPKKKTTTKKTVEKAEEK